MTRPDWPLGVALKRAREHAGLSVRAAARRTHGAVSSGRWYQLESGYQKAGGHTIPVGTTAATVAAAAKAVDWDIDEALTIAGFDVRDYAATPESPLAQYADDELLAEIRRRMKGMTHAISGDATTQPDASGETAEDQEVSDDAAETGTWAGAPLRQDAAGRANEETV